MKFDSVNQVKLNFTCETPASPQHSPCSASDWKSTEYSAGISQDSSFHVALQSYENLPACQDSCSVLQCGKIKPWSIDSN